MNSKLITPESPLLVPPLLATEIGWESAMILQQIHYFCDRSKHIRPDGRRWFWLTYEGWGQKIPFLKLSTIRRAIDKLRQLHLIDVFRHSQRTWYQANWYTVNLENVKALWLSICQKQQMQVSTTDISNCSEPADYIRDYSSKINSPQDSAAVGEEELGEVYWDFLKNQVEEEQARLVSECLITQEQVTLVSNQEESDQTTDTCFVDEPEEADLSNESISHEDNHSAAVGKVKTVTTSQNRKSNKPSREEIREVERELRSLRVNPDACMSVIVSNWGNVQGAIAYLKEALQTWKEVKSPIAVFRSACQKGLKPEGSTTAVGFNEWFDWARRQRIVLASTTIDGVHCVMLDDRWIPTAKAMQMYPKASASPYRVAEPQAAEMEC
ncbi:MAG: hypothetical protein KME30_28925 [Iphinoe sp. HA4291-MV1]|jgi:hypothetical protein|nr:hypothetical protein [Iphinoe sp. HA4291-MV1]